MEQTEDCLAAWKHGRVRQTKSVFTPLAKNSPRLMETDGWLPC